MALVLVIPHPVAHAMDLPHYDLDSLAYMSTDIVIATLSVSSKRRFTAAVTESLYGTLRPGDTIDTLSDFLGFFQPLENGQRTILFLDRRSHPASFLYREASKSPFAVPPSGVYMIDAYEHVHEYYQQNNPGPYVAEGYQFRWDTKVPTKEEDLALPSLQDVRARIAASLKSLQTIRPLLDKTATPEDVPALIALLDARSKARKACGWRAADALVERLGTQLRSLNDPETALRGYSLAPDWHSRLDFVQLAGAGVDKNVSAGRVKYFLETLSDSGKDLSLRIASIEILLEVSRFHSGTHTGPSQWLPIDDLRLAAFAGDIQSTALLIFHDDSQDGRLRGLCLRFLPLDQPDIVAVVRQVYARTKSEELRFAIEESFLETSDGLYESLSPPGGPIASLVIVAPERSCVAKASAGNLAFLAKYHEEKDFKTGAGRQFVLTSARTGQRFTPKISFLVGGWGSERTGEIGFELSQPLEVPVGEYTIATEYSRNGEVLSTGHKLLVIVSDAPEGRRLSVK